MKILWQAYDYKGYTGGPIINTVRLLPEFLKKGHTVHAIIGYTGDNHPSADKLHELGIQVYCYQIPRDPKRHVKIFLSHIIKTNPDIFVSNISVHAALAGRWAIKWGIPVVHTHRSDDDLNNGTAKFFFKGSQKWRLSALMSVNQHLINKLDLDIDSKVITKVIPSGVPISNYRSNQAPNDGKISIIYAGRIIQKQKRLNELVESFLFLARENPNLIFHIIGNGEEGYIESIQKKIDESKLQDRIKIIGALQGDEYKKELAKHHIFTLVSDFEGIPGSVMDGMECGLVPVTLKMEGINELIIDMHNGLIVHDRHEDFHKAIVKLSENHELRKELSNNAVQTIINGFSLDKTVLRWEELFIELLPMVEKDRIMKQPIFLRLPKKDKRLIQHHPNVGAFRKLLLLIIKVLKSSIVK